MTIFERGKGGKKLLTSKPKQCNIKMLSQISAFTSLSLIVDVLVSPLLIELYK